VFLHFFDQKRSFSSYSFGFFKTKNVLTEFASVPGWHFSFFQRNKENGFIWWAIMFGAIGIAKRKTLMGYMS